MFENIFIWKNIFSFSKEKIFSYYKSTKSWKIIHFEGIPTTSIAILVVIPFELASKNLLSVFFVSPISRILKKKTLKIIFDFFQILRKKNVTYLLCFSRFWFQLSANGLLITYPSKKFVLVSKNQINSIINWCDAKYNYMRWSLRVFTVLIT